MVFNIPVGGHLRAWVQCAIQTYKLFIMSESCEVEPLRCLSSSARVTSKDKQQRVTKPPRCLHRFLPPSLKVFVFPHLPPPSLLYKHIWLLTSMWLSTESYWVTRPQQKHVPQWELSSVMMVVTCDCEPMKRGTQWKRNTNKTFSGIHVFVFNSLNFIKWTCGSMYVTKCGLALYVTAIVVTRF